MNSSNAKQAAKKVISSQTRKIQDKAKIKEYSKKIAERVKQKRNFMTTPVQRGGGHHDDHHHEPDEDDIKYGINVPKHPTWELLITKFLVMNFVWWVWYNLIHKDGYKRIFSLERPHYEPQMNDTDSDDDDEFWDKNFPNYMKPDQQAQEIAIQSFIHREATARPQLKDAIERWKKW